MASKAPKPRTQVERKPDYALLFTALRRPAWWPAWTDYPHGGLTEKQARELSGYCVRLEEALLHEQVDD